ncbi:MAG: hypothetical protein L0216_08710 [Planctomycetales bacterium]|nr:hypothetical protein [Planctomycetales bacterium]
MPPGAARGPGRGGGGDPGGADGGGRAIPGRALASAIALAALGCGRAPPPPAAGPPAEDGRLVSENRQLRKDLRDAQIRIQDLERDLRRERAAAAAARARLADREREAEAQRKAAGAPPAAEPADDSGETVSQFAERFLREVATEASAPGVDWEGWASAAMAAEAGLDPEDAAQALAALPEAQRGEMVARAREEYGRLLDGEDGLRALKPRVGAHYVVGPVVRVELKGESREQGEARFVLTLARTDGRWRVVGLERDRR